MQPSNFPALSAVAFKVLALVGCCYPAFHAAGIQAHAAVALCHNAALRPSEGVMGCVAFIVFFPKGEHLNGMG